MVWWAVLQQYARYFITFTAEKIINYANRDELKSTKINVFKTYMLIKTSSSEQKSKTTFMLHRFPILYITIYSYLYYFCYFTPFLWTTYCTADSYITAFSYFPRTRNNISGIRSAVFFRREIREEPTKSGKTQILFLITGPYTMTTFCYNVTSYQISPRDHQS
jgi:hypothetical protein